MNALSRRVPVLATALAAATLLLLLLISHAAQAAVLNLGPVSQAVAQAAAVEGEGTAANPYKLGTEADLALIREHPTADFELTANITVTSKWAAVPAFSGVLDGAGHSISGLVFEPTAVTYESHEEKWTALFGINTGTVERLGLVTPTSIASPKAEENKNRAGGIVLVNKGTMREDWTEGATIEGGWRGAPIATMNEALVTDCYSVNTKVVAGSEGGGLVAWTSSGGTIRNSYVAGANVKSATNSAIFAGYGYLGTRLANNVIITGSLSNTGSNQGRIMARENGTPTYSNDLSLKAATINGATVTGGTLTNKQGQDTEESELKLQSTYEGIGWNFETVWAWSATLERPVLLATVEAEGGAPPVPVVHQIGSEAELAQLREHPSWDFELTADITMTAPWAPAPIFSGVLNGAGHTITGLEVEGTASKAFIVESTGTIEDIGFEEPKSVHAVANPTLASSYSEPIRIADVTVYNLGTIDRVYTKGAVVEGGWRGAPIAACNEGLVTDSYSINTKVVANYESGALVAWESAVGAVTDSYVAGANVTTVTSNGGIFSGYTWAGTRLRGDVVYSGSLTNPNAERGRIIARENGTPTLSENLASTAATINGAAVTGGTATNRNGKDTTEAELKAEATYTAIGWDFASDWRWSPTLKRPVLQDVHEVGTPTKAEEETEEAKEIREAEEKAHKEAEEKAAKEKAEKEAKEAEEREAEELANPVEGDGTAGSPYLLNSEYDLKLIREHPTADFKLTGDITMTKGWTPIPVFSGVLDGTGHTITGLEVEGSVPGSASKAFIGTSSGTIERIGFDDAKAIITAAYAEPNRAAIIVVINTGTMREDWTENAVVEGGWRGGPLTANNEGLVTDSYTVNSRVKANWESGGLVGFNQVVGVITDSYVVGSNVTTEVSSGGIFTGYTYSGTKIAGNVVVSGSLTDVATTENKGRILARENGFPTMLNNLSLDTATINGAAVSGGASNNRNGQDTTEAELKQEGTYVGIGWDFEKVWAWSPTLERPVLRTALAAEGGPAVPAESATFQISSEADLELLRAHPDANFELTADITMTKPWKPLPAFGGTLDGNGHTITGLEVEGEASKAFIVENSGTIEKLGFIEPKSIIHAAYTEANRVAAIAVINAGTIERVYTKDADVEGGWRTAPIAANNEGTVIDSYAVGSKVVSNYESGALVGWNFVGAVVKDSYVVGANVTDVTSNSGILGGYGWGVTNGKAATLYEGDVVYSGSLTGPSGANKGRIDGQEKGAPTFVGNLASTAATINGAAVTGGLATNKNGQDTAPAELEAEATYTGIGWDFTNVWEWDAARDRPVLRGLVEPISAAEEAPVTPETPVVSVSHTVVTYQVDSHPSGAELLAATGATTTVGTLAIVSGGANFELAGEYPIEIGAANEGVEATPVRVTIKVVPVTTIKVTNSTVSLPASVAPITAGEVIAAAGAVANNGATVTAGVSAVRSDEPGSYQVTLAATDPFGFTVAPLTVTVDVVAATTQTALVASASSQTYGTSTPATLTVTVAGGDGGELAGTVGLFDGSTQIASAPLEEGEATFTLSGTLAVGEHSLTAKFVSVSSASKGSESAPVQVAVTEVVTTPPNETKTPEGGGQGQGNTNPPSSQSSSSNPPASAPSTGTTTPARSTTKPKSSKATKEATKTTVKIANGKRPELTIKVTGGSGKVDGQVKVYVDSQVVKTVTVKNGTAELALPLKPGTHKVKAVFSGGSSLKPSTSATLKVTVHP